MTKLFNIVQSDPVFGQKDEKQWHIKHGKDRNMVLEVDAAQLRESDGLAKVKSKCKFIGRSAKQAG